MRLALTYDDVLLVPKKSPLNSRREAKLRTLFTRNMQLNNPLVSANMATVTENKMAIAMARDGGLGIIHQFCSIEDQVMEVEKAKRDTSFVIENPVTVSPDIALKDSLTLMKAEKVSSLLVVKNNILIGILTSRDYHFENDRNKLVSELMTNSLITA